MRKRRHALLGCLVTAASLATLISVAPPAHAAGSLLKNKLTTMCADLPGHGKPEGIDGPVNQFWCDPTGDNQLWVLMVPSDGGGAFAIQNFVSERCMDVFGTGPVPEGEPIGEHPCRPWNDNQLFRAHEAQSAGRDYFYLKHELTGLCLDVAGVKGSGGQNARLTLATCRADDDHIWSWV